MNNQVMIEKEKKTLDYDYKLIILGNPKAQKRHRTMSKDKFGRALRFPIRYDPSAEDKSNLLSVVQQKAPPEPMRCPLRVDIRLYYPRPKSHYGTGRNAGSLKEGAPTWHTKKPDRDNADKLILDALTGVFWIDDSVICAGEITKMYSCRPRTEIYIKKL